MAQPIPSDYAVFRKITTGAADPSGLRLVFALDGNRVFGHVEGAEALHGRAKVVAVGLASAIADDAAHAAVAALKRRVGVVRECRVRFLKPLYAAEAFRVDAHVLRELPDRIVVQARLVNAREQLCVEADVELFPVGLEQARRMAPDGMIPPELRRYLP